MTNKHEARHTRHRRLLADAVGLLVIGTLLVVVYGTIIAAIFGIDWIGYGP